MQPINVQFYLICVMFILAAGACNQPMNHEFGLLPISAELGICFGVRFEFASSLLQNLLRNRCNGHLVSFEFGLRICTEFDIKMISVSKTHKNEIINDFMHISAFKIYSN